MTVLELVSKLYSPLTISFRLLGFVTPSRDTCASQLWASQGAMAVTLMWGPMGSTRSPRASNAVGRCLGAPDLTRVVPLCTTPPLLGCGPFWTVPSVPWILADLVERANQDISRWGLSTT